MKSGVAIGPIFSLTDERIQRGSQCDTEYISTGLKSNSTVDGTWLLSFKDCLCECVS